jgi:hypothetical protein
LVSRGCPGQAPKTSDFFYFENLLLRRAGCGYVNAVSEEAANLVTVAVSGAFIEGIHMPAFGAGIYKKGGNPKFVLFNLALMPHPDAGYEAWRAVVRCVPCGPGFKVLTAVSQRLGATDRYCGAGGYTCTLAPAGFRPGSVLLEASEVQFVHEYKIRLRPDVGPQKLPAIPSQAENRPGAVSMYILRSLRYASHGSRRNGTQLVRPSSGPSRMQSRELPCRGWNPYPFSSSCQWA